MRQQRHDILFQLAQLLDIKGIIPADVDQHLDAAIEFQQRLRCGRLGAGALQRAEGEHGGCCSPRVLSPL